MIKLNRTNGSIIRVAVEHIIAVQGDTQAEVKTTFENYLVKESPEEVARKVLEYKLALARYGYAIKVSYETEIGNAIDVAVNIADQLERLAGLEESQ